MTEYSSEATGTPEEINWVDLDELAPGSPTEVISPPTPASSSKHRRTLVLVETAFLASTASLIWLINFYFPIGPLLRLFFPLPIALVFLRWGSRAAWMATLVSGLLLSILMGPTRSIIYVIPYGIMGVQLGWMWRKQVGWEWSIALGTVLGTIGFFFRVWLLSFLLGEDLWVYVISQISELADWIFLHLGLLVQPNLMFIQLLAIAMLLLNSVLYLFVVHLVALVMLDRLGNPIPRPPYWVQVLIEYEE
ncbi:Protein of unknown function DUF2232, membrane [[Leptolyngbya] sp. PCC 7376]|uniref:DUF2232 domain-containing protein n=1 Tax=[Leptolyngbya] sp. PCC 7376 TaxID=111781 RepID=UPI00029F3E6A|nr:DUF2232 domain-containing protein [[Leptolyngbya] sp. PCC 7376]AFY40420.1 Protein of unknown function DUF2232, membrane [[Leptolyngbya] sp. PCC 7376]